MKSVDLTLNLYSMNTEPVQLVQGDYDATTLSTTFVDIDGSTLDLTGKTVSFKVLKADNTEFSTASVTVSGSTASVILAGQALTAKGTNYGEFRIATDSGVKKVPRFEINVQESPELPDTQSKSELQELNQAIEKTKNLPKIGENGNWETYNGTAYEDTGKPSQGGVGPQGIQGIQGAAGTAATISVGTVTTLPAGSQATATNAGTENAAVINFGIPKGADGEGGGITQDLADARYAGINHTHTAAQVGARPDTWMPTAADVGAAPSSHTSETVSTESGVHGLRYYSEKLQAKDANGDWQDITTGSSGFAPKDVSGLSASAGNTQVTILWSDPPDSVVDGTTISKWAGSKLVRKEGSYPTAPTDGTLLIDNTVRDKYKTVGYADTGLTNGTAYYYAVFPYSDSGAVNTNETNRVSATPQAHVKYGVRWYKNQSSPTLERLYDSAGFTFSATNGSTAGSSDFDGKPIYKDIKLCNVQSGAVTAYEGEAGFSRAPSSGDVMVEIPKFYYKVTDNGTDRTYEISDIQLDGFLVAPRHAPCEDYPNGLDKIYVGVYEASAGFKSISGQAPLVNKTRAQFRTGFSGRGAGYCQADWATQFELMILFIIETASLDSQSIVGQGNTGTSAAINTGGSDSVTGLTGSSNISSTSAAVKWRGFENLWGNVYEWRDGINFNDGLIYVCTNPSKYSDDTAADYAKLAYSKIQNNGLISSLGLDANAPWAQLPTAVAGSDSTYLCDYYYSTAGWRVSCVGGDWSDGSNAGLFCLFSSNASSSFSSHFGSRLLVLPQ